MIIFSMSTELIPGDTYGIVNNYSSVVETGKYIGRFKLSKPLTGNIMLKNNDFYVFEYLEANENGIKFFGAQPVMISKFDRDDKIEMRLEAHVYGKTIADLFFDGFHELRAAFYVAMERT